MSQPWSMLSGKINRQEDSMKDKGGKRSPELCDEGHAILLLGAGMRAGSKHGKRLSQ